MSTPARTPTTARSAGKGGFPSLLAAEIIKLKRSSVWVVAVLLPLLAVVTGTFNFYRNQGVFSAEWGVLTSQISLFYSMFFCSLGVALLASAAWRMEHRGTSWNAMRTSAHSPVSVVLAKTLVILLPVLTMQVAFIVLAWISGAFVMGLGLAMPGTIVASNLLAVVSIIPLIALQSLLSMLMRSFAAPVALGFVGCIIGFGLLGAQSSLAYATPQGLVSMTLSLGSTAMTTAGELDAASTLPLLLSTVGVGAVMWGLLVLVARRTGGVR